MSLDTAGSESIETIETLRDRLETSTLLEDRRDACRALRSLARKYRVQVGAHALESLLRAVQTDRQDTDIVNYSLDALNYIISGHLGDAPAATWAYDAPDTDVTGRDPGLELAEIFLKKSDNVATILDTVHDTDFKTRWVAVRLLCGLARHKLAMLQDCILSFPVAMSRLTDLISEEQELLRNDALVLFVRLTQSNQDIQHLVAFQGSFEKLMYIIEFESYLEGTVAVVMDCLSIFLNITQQNENNQILFRDSGYIQKFVPFFNNLKTIQWTNERTACMILVLRILDSMLLVTNSSVHVQACQDIMQRCGLLDKLFDLLTAESMPIGVHNETLNAVTDILRGHLDSNTSTVMHTSGMTPVLLLCMFKEKCQDQEKTIAKLKQDQEELRAMLQDQERIKETLRQQEKRIMDCENYMHVLHNFISNSLNSNANNTAVSNTNSNMINNNPTVNYGGIN